MAADENVDAMNQPLPPSPSDPSFISALSPSFSEKGSEDETADGDQKRILEENTAELKVEKTAPAIPQTAGLGLAVPCELLDWSRGADLGDNLERWVAVLLCAVFSVAWMLLTSAWFLN